MLLSFLACLFSCNEQPRQGEKDTTIFYFVRHAEKDMQDTTDNPPLTVEGQKRAMKLSFLLQEVTLDGVYSTEYQRNMGTVVGVAAGHGLTVQTYDWHQWQPMLDEMLVEGEGRNWLICGHGDNLIPMMEALGATPPLKSLGPDEYDKLFLVKIRGDSTWAEMQIF